jgi:hypothetical protein
VVRLSPDLELDKARSYWFGELRRRGMTLDQIDKLLETPGTEFHELVEALDAGCEVELAFRIFS